jgi:hypothetical protein
VEAPDGRMLLLTAKKIKDKRKKIKVAVAEKKEKKLTAKVTKGNAKDAEWMRPRINAIVNREGAKPRRKG